MSLAPNSRFMNELLVICRPSQTARPASPERRTGAMNGTVSAYLPLQTLAYLDAVDRVEGLVLDCDVRRVADDDVVAAFLQHVQEKLERLRWRSGRA